jgi:hypothetical protein
MPFACAEEPMKLFLIYILSTLMLGNIAYQRSLAPGPPFFRRAPTPQWLKEKKKDYLLTFKNKKLVPVFFAFMFGQTQGIDKEILAIHKKMGSMHLFTPSGLHLTAILILIPIVNYFIRNKRSKKIFANFITLTLCTFFLWIDFPMDSIKRLCLFRWCLFILNDAFKLKIPVFPIFLLSFALNPSFYPSTFNEASFAYSFLFMGIILSLTEASPFAVLCALFGGQIIANFFTQDPFYSLGFIPNHILAGLFTLLFPFLILFYCSNYKIGIEVILEFYNRLTFFFAQLASYTGTHYATMPLCWMILSFSLPSLKKYRPLLTCFLLSIHADPLNMPELLLEKKQMVRFLNSTKFSSPFNKRWQQPLKLEPKKIKQKEKIK